MTDKITRSNRTNKFNFDYKLDKSIGQPMRDTKLSNEIIKYFVSTTSETGRTSGIN